MYGFSEDEQLLVFMDCFGLTRLRRPKQVKTDGKISGSESAGRVTVSRDGSFAASYEDLWDKSVIWALPELKSAKRFDRFRERGAMVHPGGTHYIVDDSSGLRLEPLSKRVLLPLRLDAPPDAAPTGTGPVTLSLTGGELRAKLSLGGDGRPDVPMSLRVAGDGTLLRFDGTELCCATLTGTTAAVRWRRPLTAPAGARLELYADAERCVLMVHHGQRWTIFVDGPAGEQRFEIESLGVPAVAGSHLAWQPALDRVIRRELDGGEQTEYGFDIYDKKRKIELRNEGIGTIFLGAKGSLLFLTAHRESILDLIKEVEIPRKLPAKELEIRQALLDLARPYCDAARLAGACIELGRVEFNPKYNSVSITHRIAGPENLFGALLAAHSQSTWNDRKLPGGWRLGSYGSHGGIGYDPNVTAEQLVEGYAALAEAGVGFASTISFWSQQFETYGKPPSDVACLALLAQALVATVRDGADARIDYAALAARGVPSVDEVIAGFEPYPRRIGELEYRTTRFAGGLFNRLFGVDAARIWVALLLEAEWEVAGSHYGDFCSGAAIPLLDAHPEAAELFRGWFRDNSVPEDNRAHYINQLRDRLNQQ
ncbi:MAG: hypothetical protein R6X02_24765 [Enhygromyxa sp.]